MLEVIEHLNSAYIEAAAETPKVKKASWSKWVPMVACLCLLIAVLPAIIFSHEQSDELKELEQSEMFLYGGNQYYLIGSDDVPERYGFPAEIEEIHAGEMLAFLERTENGDLAVTAKETQITLFEYETASCDAAKILQYGDKWYPVIFAGVVSDNIEQLNGVEPLDMQRLYRIYGINSASDIIKFQVDSATSAECFHTEDIGEIETFYTATVGLKSLSGEEFEQSVYGEYKTYTDRENLSDAIAKDLHKLQIVTKGGLILQIQLYPSFGWIRSIEANAHYAVTDTIISLCNKLVEKE